MARIVRPRYFCAVIFISNAHVAIYMETTMIRVRKADKDRLAQFGDASDTIGDCLARVLDYAEAYKEGGRDAR